MTSTTPSHVIRSRSDGRQNPRRLKVAPPPGGKRPSDWVGLRIKTLAKIAGKPAGSEAQVWQGSHGGSGLCIRFEDGTTAGGITNKHIELL